MARKVQAAPLQSILARLDLGAFDLVVFSEATLLHEPPESWPVVDALLSWFSSGFPLAAALRYVALRKPFCVNDLEMEATLRDRRLFYSALVAAGIPTPRHVVVDREKTPDIAVVETDDSIVVGGVTLLKPFVEKPVDAENHDIRIYYPRRMGGGCKRLFRKIEDRSSTYYPEKSSVRREGSYIYELFLMTQGLDIKVYTAGPDYAHVSCTARPETPCRNVTRVIMSEARSGNLLFPLPHRRRRRASRPSSTALCCATRAARSSASPSSSRAAKRKSRGASSSPSGKTSAASTFCARRAGRASATSTAFR